VFLFGPGIFSLDALLSRFFAKTLRENKSPV
jgi:hypothetical protein